MAKWYVEIEEKLTYNLVVDAENYAQAEHNAWNSPEYVNNDWDDCDGTIVEIGIVKEPEPEREHSIIVDDEELGHAVIVTATKKEVARFLELGQAQDFIIMIEGE